MKKWNIKVIGCILLSCLFSEIYAQKDANYKTFNTLTFFYIDNSEGYTSDALNSGLNNQVGDEFKKKLNACISKPDNYFYLLGSNGEDVKTSSSLQSILESDWLKNKFHRPSKEADYDVEKKALRDNFTNFPLKIKKEVDVYLFLSAYCISQLPKRNDQLPVPLFFPKELPVYLNNKELNVNIIVYTNKDIVEKLTAAKIKSYFDFCSALLNQSDFTVDVIAY